MGIVRETPLPDLANIRRSLPLTADLRRQVAQHRSEVEDIVSGRDDRALLIVGPCSAWPDTAVLEYAQKLALLAEELKDTLRIVMRVYTQKPRTTKGWAGVVVQPNPFEKPDIAAGATYARKMMLDVLETGLPMADELLFTHKAVWLGDLLTWAAIGARSAEDQEHRVFASGLDMPVGMKNPTSGNTTIAVNSVVAAQSAHTYFNAGQQVETDGNPYAHLVLRGGSDGPNYGEETQHAVQKKFIDANVQHPALLIDASHDNTKHNSNKDYQRQVTVVEDVLRARSTREKGEDLVKGFLIESFLKDGAQALNSCTSNTVDGTGLSITDPCIGWEATEALLRDIAKRW